MINKKKFKDRNFINYNAKLKYYYMFFIFIIILIAFVMALSGCNSQIITIEQPFVLAVDKCYCQKKITDKIIIQNDSGYKYMFKDFEGYKTLTTGDGFDTTSIGSYLIGEWYQNIIIK